MQDFSDNCQDTVASLTIQVVNELNKHQYVGSGETGLFDKGKQKKCTLLKKRFVVQRGRNNCEI